MIAFSQILSIWLTKLSFSIVSSGRQPRRINYKIRRFGEHLRHQSDHPIDGDGVCLRSVGFY